MEKQITIIGCGPGSADIITIKGKKAIEKADVIIGSKRLINDFISNTSRETIILEHNYKEILDKATELIKEDKEIAFLVSGDPLFFSFGESVIKRFGNDRCEIISGISSVQYCFSKLGECWHEYKFYSLHGKKDVNIQKIFDENDKFVLLLDPKNNLQIIKSKVKLVDSSQYNFTVVSNLSLPDEKILNISFDDFDKVEEESLSILIASRI